MKPLLRLIGADDASEGTHVADKGNNYKNTMNLPQTDFPMRGNLPANEPKRLEKWEQEHLYERILEKNKDGEPFILHDGPPYANGPIHIGHAFNKILKDFVVKSHAQRGFFTPYIPGWDCHGQPIEHEVEKKLGTEKMREMPQSEVRKLCREWAERFVDVQRDGFKRLGVNGDWEHPYLTFQPTFESANVEVFKKLYLDGAVYRGRKPIHWCKHCHTALAEAEIEYADETSPSIYVRFKLFQVPEAFAQAGVELDDAYVLIWTTTPWTLPANVAVSFGPDIDYCFVKVDGAYLLFAHEMVEAVAEVCGWESYEVVSKDGKPVLMKGDAFDGITYECPILTDRVGRIVWGDHVTLDSGTGAVHTAPGHGVEDYLMGQQFGLDTLMPVDDDGRFMETVPHFAGMDTDEANPHIIDWLRERGTLVARKDISHSYPHCWRCHEPVIFRATDQWFVSMEKTGLREAALDQIHNHVTWYPSWGRQPHRSDGRRPSRLVHLAPAQLGRADPGVQVRQVRRDRRHRRDVRRGDRPVQLRGRRRLVHQGPLRVPARRHALRGMRRRGARAREGHPRRVVGKRREPRGACSSTAPRRIICAGRPTCT